MASNVIIRRNTPTAANLTNLYDYINKTFQETDLFYTKEETDKLKENDTHGVTTTAVVTRFLPLCLRTQRDYIENLSPKCAIIKY